MSDNNPNKQDNLVPFSKGYDPRRNTKGRPVVTDIKKYVKERLTYDNDKDPDKSELDAIVDKLIAKALEGNLKAMELCMQYGFGRPTQLIELTGKDGQSLNVSSFSNLTNDQLRDRIKELKAAAEDGPSETAGG